jgi:hypothetical protein
MVMEEEELLNIKIQRNILAIEEGIEEVYNIHEDRDVLYRKGVDNPKKFNIFQNEVNPGRCNKCEEECKRVSDSIICWNCKMYFCLYCVTGVSRLDGKKEDLISQKLSNLQWNSCFECNKDFGIMSLVTVNKQLKNKGMNIIMREIEKEMGKKNQ